MVGENYCNNSLYIQSSGWWLFERQIQTTTRKLFPLMQVKNAFAMWP